MDTPDRDPTGASERPFIEGRPPRPTSAADAFGRNLRVIYAAEATATASAIAEATAAIQNLLCPDYRQRILAIPVDDFIPGSS